MDDLTDADRQSLINAIAYREGTAKQIAQWFATTVTELRSFVSEYKEEIEQVRQVALASEKESEDGINEGTVTPTQLSDLWIANKFERLQRYQEVTDKLYKEFTQGSRDAAVMRELRFYLQAVANELGQLLHRGSGESGSDSLSVDIQGVELDNLK